MRIEWRAAIFQSIRDIELASAGAWIKRMPARIGLSETASLPILGADPSAGVGKRWWRAGRVAYINRGFDPHPNPLLL